MWRKNTTWDKVAPFLRLPDHKHTHTHTPAGLLCRSNQLVTEAATYTTHNKQQANIHAPGGIRTRDPGNRAAVYLRLRPFGHWDRQIK